MYVNPLGTLIQRRNLRITHTASDTETGPYSKSMTCYQQDIGRAIREGVTLCFVAWTETLQLCGKETSMKAKGL